MDCSTAKAMTKTLTLRSLAASFKSRAFIKNTHHAKFMWTNHNQVFDDFRLVWRSSPRLSNVPRVKTDCTVVLSKPARCTHCSISLGDRKRCHPDLCWPCYEKEIVCTKGKIRGSASLFSEKLAAKVLRKAESFEPPQQAYLRQSDRWLWTAANIQRLGENRSKYKPAFVFLHPISRLSVLR